MDPAVLLPEWVKRRIETAPEYSDKRTLAQLFTECFGPISYRTIEDRPLVWQLHNGRAVTHTRTAFEAEFARFDAAPRYRAGRSKKTA
jgi:hypothetical protein